LARISASVMVLGEMDEEVYANGYVPYLFAG
jgi:hypothetical protein